MEFPVGSPLPSASSAEFTLKSSGVNPLTCSVAWPGSVGEGPVSIEGCLSLACSVAWPGSVVGGPVFMEGSLCLSGRGLVSLATLGARALCRITAIQNI